MAKPLYIQVLSLMEVVHAKNRVFFESCLEKDATYFSFNQIFLIKNLKSLIVLKRLQCKTKAVTSFPVPCLLPGGKYI